MQSYGAGLGTSRRRRGSDGLGPSLQRCSMRQGGPPVDIEAWLDISQYADIERLTFVQ